ncbi:MAG: GIY-YIG nuclease family protein [bacterium]|nr:GIY-YIG nuclease family protein [bacterium]
MDLDFRAVLAQFDSEFLEKKIKLVRHASSAYDLPLIERRGFMREYEERQRLPVFDRVDGILSFMGEGRTRARFIGASLVGSSSSSRGPWPSGFPYPEMGRGNLCYELVPQEQFAPLRDRLVIDWGAGTRNWHQHLCAKEVLEIRPKGYVTEFPGYDDVLLTFDGLERIVSNPDANRAWHMALRAVAGVYLIVDTVSGNQYVGSAYGESGLLGRWATYVRKPHGGNAQLKVLLHEHPERHRAFQFAILRTLPKSMAKREVIGVEGMQKSRLGTRAFGLNAN